MEMEEQWPVMLVFVLAKCFSPTTLKWCLASLLSFNILKTSVCGLFELWDCNVLERSHNLSIGKNKAKTKIHISMAMWTVGVCRLRPVASLPPPSSPPHRLIYRSNASNLSFSYREKIQYGAHDETKHVYFSFFKPLKVTDKLEKESLGWVHGGELAMGRNRYKPNCGRDATLYHNDCLMINYNLTRTCTQLTHCVTLQTFTAHVCWNAAGSMFICNGGIHSDCYTGKLFQQDAADTINFRLGFASFRLFSHSRKRTGTNVQLRL